MEFNIDNLKNLLDKLKVIRFFERLFGWGKIRQMIMNAYGDMQKIIDKVEYLRNENDEIKNKKLDLERDLEIDNEKLQSLEEKVNSKKLELEGLKIKFENVETENEKLKNTNTRLINDEENRKDEFSKSMYNLNKIKEDIQVERKKEIEEKNKKEIERLQKQKETWSNHEENVKNKIKLICDKHSIEYIDKDKVPFKGAPDNTIKVCDEFIIFDAKSPSGDDLNNFPKYLKSQAESVRKYTKETLVKKDLYFVIPSNTLEVIENNVINLADYRVYIISLDSLEPIILGLKKIEEYEFAEQLSPEDRENICRVLGRFVHLSKRKIQIDSFFIKQFIELAIRSESDLPSDILEKVIEFEKAEKLNPPTEKRAKQIEVKGLEEDNLQIRSTVDAQGITVKDDDISEELNKLPLYKEEVIKNK